MQLPTINAPRALMATHFRPEGPSTQVGPVPKWSRAQVDVVPRAQGPKGPKPSGPSTQVVPGSSGRGPKGPRAQVDVRPGPKPSGPSTQVGLGSSGPGIEHEYVLC